MRWIYVSLPYATFAVQERDGVIVDAAPIARWAIGKTSKFVADYWRWKTKGRARFEVID